MSLFFKLFLFLEIFCYEKFTNRLNPQKGENSTENKQRESLIEDFDRLKHSQNSNKITFGLLVSNQNLLKHFD